MTQASTLPRSEPGTLRPMLARLTRYPFDSADHLFELKWDGIRAFALVDGPQLKLVNRNGVEVSRHFPELSGLPRQVSSDSAVLDGELVCLDKQGHPDFAMLQLRLQKPEGVRSRANPVHFIACDVLRLDGGSVMGEPLVKRKNLLHQIMKPSEIAQPCEFIENDGKAFFQATCELGLEGVVAKAKESLYFPGKRSQHWLKVKRVRESEFVGGGYTFGGNKSEAFTSLILGLHDNDGQLLCVGQLATGFTKNLGRELLPRLQALHTSECPFVVPPDIRRFIYWCRPQVVCQVEYGEITEQGQLAYPVLKALRTDKSPGECTVSDAPGWPGLLADFA